MIRRRINRNDKQTVNDLKVLFLRKYGSACSCLDCEVTEMEFLTVYSSERPDCNDEVRLFNHAINTYPNKIYKVMCYNCKSAVREPVCPHKKNKLIPQSYDSSMVEWIDHIKKRDAMNRRDAKKESR